jgi:hypothetical protein
MSNLLTISPYLCRTLDRSYRDFLEEQIARLETEPRRIGDQLAMLREERKRIGEQEQGFNKFRGDEMRRPGHAGAAFPPYKCGS